jgi:hypothetical protein
LAIDAAHITPYKDKQSNNAANGLLLRSDLHALFDGNQLAVHPTSRFVHFSPEARERDECRAIHGRQRLRRPQPGFEQHAPQTSAFRSRCKLFVREHGCSPGKLPALFVVDPYGWVSLNMFKNFTRRHRLDYFESDLQYEYIPPAFCYDLFKLVREHCDEETSTVREYCLYRGASISVNADYFRLLTIDEIQEYYSPDLFVDLLLKSKWHEVLSTVEFLINEGPLSRKEVNNLFAYHNVGYEVEKERGDPATVIVKYSTLIADNDKVISSDIPFQPVIEAINAAKQALIDPKDIDVASSVAHSVSAVEAYLRGWLDGTGLKAATLGDAIKTIKKLSLCPTHIVESLEQFYIYRNRTENVGHGAPTFANITREDALLCNEMAVSFINYFHRKSVPNKVQPSGPRGRRTRRPNHGR